MNREELTALRDALEALLAWPDGVRAQMAQWLTPEAAKPNGRDDPPPIVPATTSQRREGSPPKPPAAYAGKARRGNPRAPRPGGTPAERKLIEAMRAAPGASVIMLARSIGGNRSSVGEQLRKLALAGAIEKASDGHWRLKAEETESRPMQPPAG